MSKSKKSIPVKRILFVFAVSMLYIFAPAQDLGQKVAVEICHCIDTIENMDSLEAKIDRCAYEALETVLTNTSDEIQEAYSNDEAIVEIMNNAMEMLLSECPLIRTFIIGERTAKFYKMSESEAANKLYEDGNKLLGEEKYKEAVKLYLKASRKDPVFIYPIDNTGLAYRKLGDYRKAVKYYLRSLDIYPEGSFALQNLGAAYTNLNQVKDALTCYEKLMFFYPENPEGYFGTGKLFVIAGEYEQAIDYIFIAHKIYSLSGSENVKDSEKMALIIYEKLKEQKRSEIFNLKAKEYGILLNN